MKDIKEQESEVYHVRHFLNKEGTLANSQITAFYGKVPYETTDGNTNYYTEKSLSISDCSKTIRLHEAYGKPHQDFVDKLRLIAKVCNDFADHLTEQELKNSNTESEP